MISDGSRIFCGWHTPCFLGIGTSCASVIPYVGETLLDLPNGGLHVGATEA